MSSQQQTIPIGPASTFGWGTAATAFIGAVIAYLTGDQSAQSVTAVELAGVGLIAGGVTQLGRYLQAHKSIKAAELVEHVGGDLEHLSSEQLHSDIENIKKLIMNISNDPGSVIHDVENFASGTGPEVITPQTSPVTEPPK